MNNSVNNLREMVRDGIYVIDEDAVARSILARMEVRASVGQASFRSEVLVPSVRSFRRDPHARSFRLERGLRMQSVIH